MMLALIIMILIIAASLGLGYHLGKVVGWNAGRRALQRVTEHEFTFAETKSFLYGLHKRDVQ